MFRKGKFHNRKLDKKRIAIFLLIMCFVVGFSVLTSNLNITGTASVSGNKWSIYFDNIQVANGSVEATIPRIDTSKTSVDFSVTLEKPGDFYEFTVDAVNDGTLDAMVESVLKTQLTEEILKYVRYTITYVDGRTIAKNNLLEAESKVTYQIRIEYRKDIESEDLANEDINLDLTFAVNYIQSTMQYSDFVKLVKKNALSDKDIDFTQNSSDENGEGLYLLSGTENSKHPIYYYRGAVEDNNAKFAGFCWKIVRTTETGGTKLIYNGRPNANGECTNKTGTSTQITTAKYSSSYSSVAYNGYMYGTVYNSVRPIYWSTDNHLYGTGFTYENGTYKLTNGQRYVNNNRHYTCFNASGVCTEISYVSCFASDNLFEYIYYITMKDGKSVEDALSEMTLNSTNTTNSLVKTAIDTWFSETFSTYFTEQQKNYLDYLEDTVWCNDRTYREDESSYAFSKSGWNPDGGNLRTYLYYSAHGRKETGAPSLACSNKNDAFTVIQKENGNGSLTYPVGLLTTDEMLLAGISGTANTTNYLYTNQNWWTMTPAAYTNYAANMYLLGSNGSLSTNFVTNAYGLRPSISIASTVKIRDGGDGSSSKPYEFVVD